MGIWDSVKNTVDEAVDEAEDKFQGATGIDAGGSGGGRNADDVTDTNEDTSEGVTDNPGQAVSEGTEAAGQVVDRVEDTVQETTGQDLGGSGGGSSDTDTDTAESAVDVDAGGTSGSESDVAGGGTSNPSSGGPAISNGGSGGSNGSGSRPPTTDSPGSTPSDEQLRNQLMGNNPGSGKDVSPRDQLNRTEATDRNIINEDFAKTGGSIFENPVNREITNALYGSGEASTFNEAFNNQMRNTNAQNVIQSDKTIDRAQNRKDELASTIDNIQGGPTKQDRLQDLRNQKKDLESTYQDNTRYRIDPDELSETQKEQLGYNEPESSTGDPSLVLTGKQIESRILQNSGLQESVNNLENTQGLYTIQTTNEQGETVTKTVTRDEALDKLNTAQSNLDNQISQFRDQANSSINNLFQGPEGSEGPAWGKQSFSEISGESRSGRESSQEVPTNQYRANPQAISKINALQDQLSNSVMTQDQRQEIRDQIDRLQTEAQQSAEQPGGTNIPGQTPYSRIPLPESAQDNTVWTAPSGPGEKFVREVSDSFREFGEKPEPRNVNNVELSNDLLTQVGAGVDTLSSKEGYTYIASAVPGGRSPEDVAEESIERRMNNPQTGPGKLGEAAISSPAGLVATTGAGALVGTGGRVASLLGSSPRVAQAARVAGAGATGLYAGSQGAKIKSDLEAGRTTQAGGEVLRTAGELGAFGKGLKAFRRYDAPTMGRTTVSQADNTLRQVDDGFTGSGRMTARTNFERGPFSQKLGADETGEVATDINYKIVGDETQSDFQGSLTQELPDSDETTEKSLEGFSRVIDEAGEDGAQTVTRDVVRTQEEGRLFRTFNDFQDTSINRRIDQEQVNQLRRTDDEFIYQDTGESFVNPSRQRTGVEADIPVDAQISRYESFSVADNNQLPPEETFGSSRTLIFGNADEGAGGAAGGVTGSGGGDGRYLTVQELGGVPAGGEPVSGRGLYSQARSAARNALGPNTEGYEVISGGAGVGIGRQAALDLQGDGQRSVNQFGDDGSVQNFQAQGDVSLSRNQVQSQRFSTEGGQMVRTGGVQVQRTGSPNQDFRGSITEQLGETRTNYQGENVDTLRRTPAGNPLSERSRGRERPIGVSDRINNIRSRGRSRSRVGLDLELGIAQGQKTFQRNFQNQFQFQGTDQVQFQGAETVQVPRLQLRSFQTTRPVTTTVTTGRPGRITGRPGMPGFDFGGLNFSGEGESTGRGIRLRGETDPTYDIISAGAVEARTDEQARFDVDNRESLVKKQEDLGAFVRNKPIQAQNIEYGKSETSRREFF